MDAWWSHLKSTCLIRTIFGLLERVNTLVLHINIQLDKLQIGGFSIQVVTNTVCTVPRHLHSVRQICHGFVVSGYWRYTLPYSNSRLQNSTAYNNISLEPIVVPPQKFHQTEIMTE